jgi:hypothetical protein
MSFNEFQRLKVGTPTKARPTKTSFPTQVKAVRSWIEALPLANGNVTARLLHNGLRELNQLEVEPGTRLEILELLRHPAHLLMGSMEKLVVNQPLPLPMAKRQVGTVMRDFQRELAMGYRQVALDMCAPR